MAVGDLEYGQCGTTDATTTKIHATFLHKADDYYNNHGYEAYVYAGTNIGEAALVKDWVNSSQLLEIFETLDAACDATSYVEIHRIFREHEYRKAINLAIESIAGNYLIEIIDDTTTLVADTYEYALPLSMLYLYRVTTEHEVDGDAFYESDVIDPRDWSIIKAYPPYLKLDKDLYYITADKDLRLEGQAAQDIVDDDTDVINLPPDWLIQKAITFLPMNKIQSNNLDNTYRQALILSAKVPHAGSDPKAQRIVE
jgi:hypothetical protein